jgi:hypothetical protein
MLYQLEHGAYVSLQRLNDVRRPTKSSCMCASCFDSDYLDEPHDHTQMEELHGQGEQDGARHRRDWAAGRRGRPPPAVRGWTVRALTRNTSSHSAQRLARQGIEVAPGDFNDLASLERAATGVYGVYSVHDA